MKYYTENLAYDYDLFLSKERRGQASAGTYSVDNTAPALVPEKRKENIVRMPKKRVNKTEQRNNAAKAIAGKLSSVLIIGLIIGILCMSLYLRTEITETSDRINKSQATLDELKSEETRLLMEMERKISYKNIEQAAEALGMQKKEKSQVTYIRVNQENKSQVVDGRSPIVAGATALFAENDE